MEIKKYCNVSETGICDLLGSVQSFNVFCVQDVEWVKWAWSRDGPPRLLSAADPQTGVVFYQGPSDMMTSSSAMRARKIIIDPYLPYLRAIWIVQKDNIL